MAEILDNEEITTEILNEISTDLGGPELQFDAENKFGNSELNQITGDLVSCGILNSHNKCQCTISEEKIFVNTGIVVFSDGAKKRITETNQLDVLSGGINYIFVKNDTATGKIYLVNSLNEPTGDYVILATLDENGELTDRRVYAKAKVDLPSEGNSYRKNVTGTVYADTDEEISLNITNASKVFIRAKIADYERIGIFDIETSTFTANDLSAVCALVAPTVSLFVGNNSSSTWRAYVGYEGVVNDVATFVVQATADAAYDIDFYVFGGI